MSYIIALVRKCKQKTQLCIMLSCLLFITACANSVLLYHTSAESLIEQGRQAEEHGNIVAATRAYEEAAKLSGRGNMYLGNLAYTQKNFAQAEKQYRLALRDIPGSAALYNNLAWSLLKQNHKLAEAEAFAKLAVQRADQKNMSITWETLYTIQKVRQTQLSAKKPKRSRQRTPSKQAIPTQKSPNTLVQQALQELQASPLPVEP